MKREEAPWPYGVVMPTEKRGLPRKGYTKHLNGCWTYEGFLDKDGYGIVTLHLESGRTTSTRAHRFLWTMWVGPIKEGMQLDHKCRTRSCVNPKHLREVTHLENMALAQPYRVKKTHCKRGHELRDGNTYIYKVCRTCKTCHWAHNHMRYNNIPLREAMTLMEQRLGTGSRKRTLPRRRKKELTRVA